MMRPRSALFAYQEDAAARLVAARQMACFLEPGLGKTATTLTAMHDLGRPRTLVLAPARVAETVWHTEAAKWQHLRGMRVTPAVGDRAQRTIAVMDPDNHVVTLSYENFPWLLDLLNKGGRCTLDQHFQAVVFDELSRMKNADSVKFNRFRGPVRRVPIRFGLTGTPVGNHLADIWGEMFMVAGEKPLGPTKGEFVARYFAPQAVINGRVVSWRPHPGSQREIEQRIKPYAFTLRPTGAPKMPDLKVNIMPVALPTKVQEMARLLADELTVQLESGTDLYAFSQITATAKVRQMVGGAVYVEPPTVLGEPPPTGPKKWEHIHDEKLKALDELVDEMQGEPLLVFYWFKHEAERLLKHFGSRAVELDSAARIDQWNKRGVEVMLAHPASAGHGLNLQHGGHNICWYTLPYSLEMWKQANGRLVRTGQPSPFVNAHVLLAGRADEVVLATLHRKADVEDQLLAAMLA